MGSNGGGGGRGRGRLVGGGRFIQPARVLTPVTTAQVGLRGPAGRTTDATRPVSLLQGNRPGANRVETRAQVRPRGFVGTVGGTEMGRLMNSPGTQRAPITRNLNPGATTAAVNTRMNLRGTRSSVRPGQRTLQLERTVQQANRRRRG